MKYSDKQRIQKIYEYAEKLLTHINENNISKEKLINDYALQWLVTTPLYNIGEGFMHCPTAINPLIAISHGL